MLEYNIIKALLNECLGTNKIMFISDNKMYIKDTMIILHFDGDNINIV